MYSLTHKGTSTVLQMNKVDGPVADCSGDQEELDIMHYYRVGQRETEMQTTAKTSLWWHPCSWHLARHDFGHI